MCTYLIYINNPENVVHWYADCKYSGLLQKVENYFISFGYYTIIYETVQHYYSYNLVCVYYNII